MFIVELNFISLGKLFQMVTARYKKLRWPVAVLTKDLLKVLRSYVTCVLHNARISNVWSLKYDDNEAFSAG